MILLQNMTAWTPRDKCILATLPYGPHTHAVSESLGSPRYGAFSLGEGQSMTEVSKEWCLPHPPNPFTNSRVIYSLHPDAILTPGEGSHVGIEKVVRVHTVLPLSGPTL